MSCTIRMESNSINVNGHIPKQAGSTQQTTLVFFLSTRKKGSISKNSVEILVWYLLPCQQCSEIKEKIQSPCTQKFQSPWQRAEFKSSDVSLHLGRHFYKIPQLSEVDPTILDKSFVSWVASGTSCLLQDSVPCSFASSLVAVRTAQGRGHQSILQS